MNYDLFLDPEVHQMRKKLPGVVRQRVHRILTDLAANPHPVGSRKLTIADTEHPEYIEVWRIRLEQWRIVYVIHEQDKWIRVVGIQQRPPYDYQDVPEILKGIDE